MTPDEAQAPATPAEPGTSRRGFLLAASAVAAVAAGAGAAVAWRRFSLAEPAQDLGGFWGLDWPMLDGSSLPAASLRGKPLLVNFWATWCPPCVEELPLLSRFYDENKANGWQLLGLAVDRPEPVQRFLARSPISFAVALAGLDGVNLSKSLGNTGGGLPFTVVFGADGQVRERKIGQVHASDLAKWREIG